MPDTLKGAEYFRSQFTAVTQRELKFILLICFPVSIHFNEVAEWFHIADLSTAM